MVKNRVPVETIFFLILQTAFDEVLVVFWDVIFGNKLYSQFTSLFYQWQKLENTCNVWLKLPRIYVLAIYQLVGYQANWPNITFKSVYHILFTVTFQQLRRHISWRSTYTLSWVGVCCVFRQTKIAYFENCFVLFGVVD
jgi:hypothetical protein